MSGGIPACSSQLDRPALSPLAAREVRMECRSLHHRACWVLQAVLFVTLLSCVWCQRAVKHLTSGTFEHDTQAATGQTAGPWYRPDSSERFACAPRRHGGVQCRCIRHAHIAQ